MRKDGVIDAPSGGTLRREKSWNSWKKDAGLETYTSSGHNRGWTKQEAIDAICEADSLVDGMIDGPTYKRIRKSGKIDGPSVTAICDNWGWNDLKEEIGLEIYEHDGKHAANAREAYQEQAKYSVPVRFHRTSDSVGGVYETARTAENEKVRVHRLQIVAYEGMGAVDGMHVHHKSGHGLDNRPENLEVMTPAEHSRMHQLERNE